MQQVTNERYLELVAPGKLRLRRSRGLAACCRDREARRGCRGKSNVRNANDLSRKGTARRSQIRYYVENFVPTYLANVHVVADRIELGVVVVENGGVDTVGVVKLVARVVGLDNMSVRAVVALSTKAEVLADLKIVT